MKNYEIRPLRVTVGMFDFVCLWCVILFAILAMENLFSSEGFYFRWDIAINRSIGIVTIWFTVRFADFLKQSKAVKMREEMRRREAEAQRWVREA